MLSGFVFYYVMKSVKTVENNKNKKSVKFHGVMLIFCDFVQVYVFTTNHHLKRFVFLQLRPTT